MTIYLRNISFNYLDGVHEILSDSENLKYSEIPYSKNLDYTKRQIEFYITNTHDIDGKVILNEEEKVVGLILLFDCQNFVEVDIACNKKYQKNGYAEEALEELINEFKEEGIYNKMYIRIFEEDYKTKNLVKKLGFKQVYNENYIFDYGLERFVLYL